MAHEASYQPRVVPLSGAIVAVIIAVMAGFVVGKVFSGPPKRRAAASAPAQPRKVAGDVEGKAASQGNPPAKGPASAKAVLVQFCDFGCGFCGKVAPTIKELEKNYGDRLRVVFRQFPLNPDRTKLAAEASVEAHVQGRFWQYHDKLFANSQALGRADLERYAQEIGLDMARFRTALDNRMHSSVVEADMALGRSAGVSGTPTFVLNGYQFSGALPVDQFSKMIDDALAGRPVSRPAQRGAAGADGAPQAPRKTGLERADLERYAAQAGLDAAAFKTALDGGAYKRAPDADIALSRQAGVTGTPTFLIGGQIVSGAKPFEQFAEMIDRALRGEPTGDPQARDVSPDLARRLATEGGPAAVGPEGAALTIVQFCDFECPFCRRVFPTVKQIRERYGDRVRMVFRQFPLDFHPKARPAHEGALAAHAQGKFWEYYSAVYDALTALAGAAAPPEGGGCG